MRYRRLGNSDIEVSEIALGSWLTYGVTVERDRARACIRRAFDLGINFVDTANMYGRGAAESILGELLSPYRREAYVLATELPNKPHTLTVRMTDSKNPKSKAHAARIVHFLVNQPAQPKSPNPPPK